MVVGNEIMIKWIVDIRLSEVFIYRVAASHDSSEKEKDCT